MEARINASSSSFQDMSHEELVIRIQDLEEQLHMNRAFLNAPEQEVVEVEDATLYWRDSKQFLTETIIPVKLEPVKVESLYPEQGPHWIIDGDNLSVMQSLLTDFRGGPTKGFDVIYMDPPYNTGQDIFSYTLSGDLTDLLPGKTGEEKERYLFKRKLLAVVQ